MTISTSHLNHLIQDSNVAILSRWLPPNGTLRRNHTSHRHASGMYIHDVEWRMFTPPLKKRTYPTKREIRKIIDSKVPFKMGYVGSCQGKISKKLRLLFVHPDAGRSSGRFQPSVTGPPYSEAWQLGTPATMEVKKWTCSKFMYQSIKVVEDGHMQAQRHAQWTIPRLNLSCRPTIPSFSGRDKLRSTCSMLVSILICKSFAVDI